MKKDISPKTLEQQGFTLIDQNAESGFTLIELSIVLVIIGLIVGGVLVGQDLIKTAQIRSTITQIGNYNAAVNTFRGKYNGLPGDLPSPTNYFSAVAAGFNGGAGLADGNGTIDASAATKADNETVLAWYEMNQANEQGEALGDSAVGAATALPGNILPEMKIGRGSIALRSAGGQNFFELGVWGGTEAAATLAAGLTPIEALGLDSKMDDGLPASGTIIALGTTAGQFANPATYVQNGSAGGASPGDCENTTAPVSYATAKQNVSNFVGCTLSIRGAF